MILITLEEISTQKIKIGSDGKVEIVTLETMKRDS
jgi:hypothetical protein